MIRTFLAIELPQKIIEELKAEQLRWKANGPRAKWVRPENMHLTLKFLGEIPRKRVDQVIEVARECCSRHRSFVLNISGKGAFPNLRRPRVLWVGVHGDLEAVKDLHSDLESGLQDIGFPAEDRNFSPHITVARLKGSVPSTALGNFLKGNISLGPIHVNEIIVFQSKLSSSGPTYIPLARIPLPERPAS